MPNPKDYDTIIPREWTRFNSGVATSSGSVANHYRSYRLATPFQRRKKPEGFIPPTAYSLDEVSWERAVGTYGNDFQQVYWTGSQPDHPSPESCMLVDLADLGIPATFPVDLANKALMKLRQRLKDQSVNLGQAFGERRQTAQFVGDTLGRLGRAARDIRRGNFRRGLNHIGVSANPKELGGAILAYQYGAKPLCSDIYGAVEALDKRNRDDWMVTVKGSSSEIYPVSGSWTYPLRSSRERRLIEGGILYGAYARADLVPKNDALISAVSLGLTNPVSLAWELAPFSFVVDWALPLGEYFSQFDAHLGYEVRGYSMSVFLKQKLFWRGLGSPVGNGYTYLNDISQRYSRVYLNRTVSDTIPFAAFLGLKDPFSKTHVLNGLALLAAGHGRTFR